MSIIDSRTPTDVVDELIETLKDLNGIAGASSFVELYVKVPEMEAKWPEKRRDDR